MTPSCQAWLLTKFCDVEWHDIVVFTPIKCRCWLPPVSQPVHRRSHDEKESCFFDRGRGWIFSCLTDFCLHSPHYRRRHNLNTRAGVIPHADAKQSRMHLPKLLCKSFSGEETWRRRRSISKQKRIRFSIRFCQRPYLQMLRSRTAACLYPTPAFWLSFLCVVNICYLALDLLEQYAVL